jgi:hypothetical protein
MPERATGESGDCFGGSTYDREDALYEWQGPTATPS